MALRSTVQSITTRSEYGRLPTAKSFYDKVKPRAALGSLNNAKLSKDHHEGAMKSKVAVVRPVKIEHVSRAPPQEEMDVAIVTQQLADMLHIKDIDSADADNPQLCSEYVKDIYLYMRELERKFHVSPTYMTSQTQLNAKMRAILVDWLVQVHLKFTLLQETLYLTVCIIDRYLSTQQVAKGNLQLVGVTAMLLACKYEEMYAPEVSDFVYITDKTYTADAILKLEMKMLKELDYSLGNPLPLHFLRRYSRAGETTPEIHTMAKFLIELSLPSYPMLEFHPSLLAAGALYLAIQLCGSGEWTRSLVYYSTYSEDQLIPCVKQMARLLVAMPTSKQQAIRMKYSEQKFLAVAKSECLKGSIVRTLAS